VLLDDSHFALAGLDPETLGGYYVTEEQGQTLAVFPISQRLRYLIPFADVDKTLEYLEARRGAVPAVTVVDDGEKFGAWPGTYEHVYRDGWLDRFFERLQATPWLRMSTFADVLDRVPAAGRVYLPTASYREMGEWALPAAAAAALERARHALGSDDGELSSLLRGGFWRGFLVKYPEVADMYWKMLRLSAAMAEAERRRPNDPTLLAARESLWRGQANDAYWHGVFGGCYLPHLRRAVKSALLEAERGLDAAVGVAASAQTVDADGDGSDEVLVRTPELAVTVAPARGGTVTELAYLPRTLDLADVLTRRPEGYHARLTAEAARPEGARTIHDAPGHKEAGLAARLAYDPFRRASLLDGLFAPGEPLDAVAPWAAAQRAFAGVRLSHGVDRTDGGVTLTLTADGDGAAALVKRLGVRAATLRADYRLDTSEPARWAVQWNLALTAGDAPGRYLTLPDRPSLASTGRRHDVDTVTLVDEWIGVRAQLTWRPGAVLAWGPVETVSVSEAGFERIYQGLALLLTWPLDAGATELWTAVTMSAT